MPKIRVVLRTANTDGDLVSSDIMKSSSRRRARAAVREIARYVDQTQPSWLRSVSPIKILPARRACAFRTRDYYALTGLSPRLERHCNVALGF